MSALPPATGRTLWKNSLSQVLGRLLLSLVRFVAAAVIVRYAGAERYGEYALLLNFLFLFEFLTEFGQVEIGVRNVCQNPEREAVILRALRRLQHIKGALFALSFPLLIYVMDYQPDAVRAAAIGSLGILCYAAQQVFRVSFKVHMTMQRDMVAELAGVAAMLPLTWLVCVHGGGLEWLIGCYTVSRVVFFATAVVVGRERARLQRGPFDIGEAVQLWRQALPVGLTGLSVVVYDSLPPVLLSKLADMHSVAVFVGVCRYLFPAVLLVQGIITAFYPVLSARWKTSTTGFAQLQQIALEAGLLVGAGLACGIFAGASFLMRLIGPSLEEGATTLQLMAAVIVCRTLTGVMSPLFIVAGRQAMTLWLGAVAIALQAAALCVLIPRLGVNGVAVACLLTELAGGVLPLCLIGQRVSGISLNWRTPLKIMASAVIAATVCELLPFARTLWGGMLATALYVGLVIATGAISLRSLRQASQPVTAASSQPSAKSRRNRRVLVGLPPASLPPRLGSM